MVMVMTPVCWPGQIAAAVAHTVDGKPAFPSVHVPRPIPGLVSKRVLVMDFVKGGSVVATREGVGHRKVAARGDEPSGWQVCP
jgi:hypothetical protein